MLGWNRSSAMAALCLGALLSECGVRADDAAVELASLLPESTNAVMMVRVKDVSQSPRGRRENWATAMESQFLAGAITLSPAMDVVVRGLSVHPEDGGSRTIYSVATWQHPTSIFDLARREGNTLEPLGERPAVRLARGALVAELKPGVTGLIKPGYRQELSRWIARAAAAGRASPSPYVLKAVSDPTAHLVIAINAAEMFSAELLAAHLRRFDSLQGSLDKIDSLAKLISYMHGITLSIRVEEATHATLSLDFAQEPSRDLAGLIRPVFAEFLGHAGAEIDEIAEATVESAGATVRLKTKLSDDSLRRVTSLLAAPAPSHALQPAPAPATPSDAAAETKLAASLNQTYFTSVYQALADLEARNRKAKDYAKTASWHEAFARKIEELPQRGVAKELREWGADVGSKLRSLAASLRGVPVRLNQLENSITYDVRYDPAWVGVNWWGGWSYDPGQVNVQTNQGAIRGEQAAAIARGAEDREAIWKMMADSTYRVRRDVLDKYNQELAIPAPAK